MNIKSLLLGSAAALVAVSGARAADAIMAPEPEPVEYVRVCDAYGAGFFYIPGTETCLSISGYVFYQIGTSTYDLGDTPAYFYGGGLGGADATDDSWVKTVRARVNFDARSETEWGTLRSYIRMQASWGGGAALWGDGPVAIDQAYIQLGGFTMGYTDTFWVTTPGGGVTSSLSHSWTGLYGNGGQQRALIGYSFNSNGFHGALALEDDGQQGDEYMPDVVGKVAYTGGWGAVWLTAAYDEDRGQAGLTVNDDSFHVQGGLHLNVPNMPGSSFRLIGVYNSADSPVYGGNSAFGVDAEWNIMASYNHAFSSTLSASLGVQYFHDLYAGLSSDVSSGVDAWAGELSLVWLPVTNFEVRSELHYDKAENVDGTFSGYLRFTRYF